jgi:hypothetical protein
MHSIVKPASILDDRAALVSWFDRTRARSTSLFRLIDEAAYYTRPITLRHPIVFYEGHIPAFAVNVLIKKGLGRPGVDERLEQLFARGIDPHDQSAADAVEGRVRNMWPSRGEVRAYVQAAEQLLRDALLNEDLVRDDVAVLRRGEAVFTVLEHEAMHQETMLYMWHRLPYALKAASAPAGYSPWVSGRPPRRETVRIDEGDARLGASHGEIPFGWDNEIGSETHHVPAFDIDVHSVMAATPPSRTGRLPTGRGCAARDACIQASGCGRGMDICGAASSRRSSCRCRGRCTSATPKRARSRHGRAAGCRPRLSITAPLSANRARRTASARIRGETSRPSTARAISTSWSGIRRRPARIRTARARGACTI